MNPIDTLTKVVGFGVKQGTTVLGKAVSTVQGLTGRGATEQQEQERETPVQQQQKRQQRAASQRRSSRQPKKLDDVSITRKVETEIFRSKSVAKGKISVNTADGVVWLRGEAKNPEQIKELEAQTAAIPEVKRVENLLHLPKTPAPTRTDTPASQRRTRSTKTTKATPAARKVTPTRTTAEATPATPKAEAAPADLAAADAGRQPAPLGTDEEKGETTNGGAPEGGA